MRESWSRQLADANLRACRRKCAPPHHARLRSPRIIGDPHITVGASKHEIFHGESRKSPFDQFCGYAIRGAPRPHPPQLVFTCDHGGHIYSSYIGGSGGEHRLLEVPFCECAMRGVPPPHPARLVFSSTKLTYEGHGGHV